MCECLDLTVAVREGLQLLCMQINRWRSVRSCSLVGSGTTGVACHFLSVVASLCNLTFFSVFLVCTVMILFWQVIRSVRLVTSVAWLLALVLLFGYHIQISCHPHSKTVVYLCSTAISLRLSCGGGPSAYRIYSVWWGTRVECLKWVSANVCASIFILFVIYFPSLLLKKNNIYNIFFCCIWQWISVNLSLCDSLYSSSDSPVVFFALIHYTFLNPIALQTWRWSLWFFFSFSLLFLFCCRWFYFSCFMFLPLE